MKLARNELAYRHAQIIDFCLLIKSFFPGYINTVLPKGFDKEKTHINSLEASDKELLLLLIRHLTILQQHYRDVVNRNHVVSSGEDIYTALYIAGSKFHPEGFLTESLQGHYRQLQMAFRDREFNRKEAQRVLLCSKTSTHRILHQLQSKDLLVLRGVGTMGRCYYRIA